ncbi:MAG TPA: phenylalanine--tRNA ligase beta subunit-related protein [Synergistales bacterium]|nr:phenylalanine--tRNA ligase beta subunit-related protein [Synergistales bacterium]
MFRYSADLTEIHPGNVMGFLCIRGIDPDGSTRDFDTYQADLENEIRENYSSLEREDLKKIPQFEIYGAYYRRFKKTYHLFLQLESIVFKGRSIPPAPPLVRVMFLGEMKNLLLTAVHDLDRISPPVNIQVSVGGEKYTGLNGKEQVLKKDDMFMSDNVGIISSIIYGPDNRTAVNERTRNALFSVYAPPGIGRERVEDHLKDMDTMIRMWSPPEITSEMIILP